MAIKRGVSLYSYQQTYMTGKLDLEGCVKAAADVGAEGIELIYEQMPLEKYPDSIYPNISEKGIRRWQDLMEKYHTKPTCMDSFIDSKIYKGRISTFQEQVQMMEQDLKLASKLGFFCIRVLALVPPEVIEASIPAAEYYGVRMGLEVHPRLDLRDQWVQNVVEIARKHNTKYAGLIPDFGIFSKGLSGAQMNYLKIMGEKPEILENIYDSFMNDMPLEEIMAQAGAAGAMERTMNMLKGSNFMSHYCDPKALEDVLDVVMHFHGKFHYMTEDYREPAINYEEPIEILKKHNWDGYISSEFEGQRTYHGQECPYVEDEIEQVRRHHVMLRRLLGEEIKE